MARMIIEIDQNQVKDVQLEGVYHVTPVFWDRVELLVDRALVKARSELLDKPLPLKVEVQADDGTEHKSSTGKSRSWKPAAVRSDASGNPGDDQRAS